MFLSRLALVACCLVIGAFLLGPCQVHAVSINMHDQVEPARHINNVLDPSDIITVSVSASTHTSCVMTMAVDWDGDVIIRRCNRTRTSDLPILTVEKLFNDVLNSLPLSMLPVSKHCTKSISYGTTHIAYGSQLSPDLTCSLDSRGKALYADVAILIKEA